MLLPIMEAINKQTAPRYLELSTKYLDEIEAEIAERNDRVFLHAWRYKDELQLRIEETRKIIDEIWSEIGN